MNFYLKRFKCHSNNINLSQNKFEFEAENNQNENDHINNELLKSHNSYSNEHSSSSENSDHSSSLHVNEIFYDTESLDSSLSDSDKVTEIITESDRLKRKINSLAEWAINTKQTKEAVKSLLEILRKDEPFLPKDRRTLCKTPASHNIIQMDNGQYLHIGFRVCLDNFLSYNIVSDDHIYIDVNVDGVPVATNTPNSLWPILINPVGYDNVLLCGTFYGPSKPTDVNEYLKQFVEDFLNIHDSYEYREKKYKIRIRAIIADAPARAFILNIRTFSGYNSCHKCKIKGLYVLHRVTFPNLNSRQRTDHDFKFKIDSKHHMDVTETNIEKLPIGCVSNVPIDYMHAVLLGVMNQMLCLWIKTRLKHYCLDLKNIRKLSSNILSIASQLPAEFCRKPRSLKYLSRYKATQYRQLLLYTLPVIAADLLKPEYYFHFLKLHVAIRILCSSDLCLQFNEFAKNLIEDFVREFALLYSPHCMSFNIHSLIHLANDVKLLNAPLDDFSAFKFENFMQFLKQIPKCGYNVLEQINNRIGERVNINGLLTFKRNKKLYSLDKMQNYKFKWINNYKFSAKYPDNFFYDKINKHIYKIFKIYNINDEIMFDCKKIKNKKPLYTSPINSSELGMFCCKKLKLGHMIVKSSVNMIKIAKFDLNNNIFFLSLIH